MNVLGFKEALDHADLIRISDDPELDIRVATPAGIALLKIIAWNDRAIDIRPKDARDLIYICQTYESLPDVQDRIYSGSELEQYGYDQTLTASHVLGSDVAALSSVASKNLLGRLLNDEMENDMGQLLLESCLHPELEFSRHEALLQAFRQGYLDG